MNTFDSLKLEALIASLGRAVAIHASNSTIASITSAVEESIADSDKEST